MSYIFIKILLKQTLDAKSTNAMVKYACVKCVEKTYSGKVLVHFGLPTVIRGFLAGDQTQFAQPLVPSLLSIVDKAQKQPMQHTSTLEAVAASIVLLRLSSILTIGA